ncbi:N-acetyltransferase [Kitasatospora azatica]|uniref:N-acetyltransferase n=1 Tax=Kitasatospora azatica TaxID=58347 RepID=UPI000B11F306|nr:N-acetyltransferase [Kitasatospora azatica]
MTAVVTAVRGRRDTTAFIRLPYRVYREDPHWVAPLERERRAFLNPRRNPFFDFGTAELFLARRGDEVVGRIAAVIDPRYNARHHPGHGLFGLFECVDDVQTAEALFTAAADWLRGRGMTAVLGPLSFSTNEECGLLTEGFDSPPTVMMAHNPPYYQRLLTECGFAKAKDLWSWRLPMPREGELPPVFDRVGDRARSRQNVTIRPLDPKRFDEDMAQVKEIYNAAWSQNWASVPLTDREFDHLLAELKPVLRPELVILAQVDGDPAAFTMWLPDANQALRAARGRLTTFGLPTGLVRMARAARRIDRVRAVAGGAKEKYRHSGLVPAVLAQAHRAAHRLGYRETEFSWVLEDNAQSNRVIQATGAVRFRTHRLYQRAIDPADTRPQERGTP